MAVKLKKKQPMGMLPFGVDEQLSVTFLEGIVGFESMKEFMLSTSKAIYPFKVLQSLQDPTVIFIVTEPRFFFRDYHFELSPVEMDSLRLSSIEEAKVLSILVVPKNPLKMTANLLAPLVINEREKIGKQVILHDSSYSVDQRLFAPDVSTGKLVPQFCVASR